LTLWAMTGVASRLAASARADRWVEWIMEALPLD
jgi:hypothetical protein